MLQNNKIKVSTDISRRFVSNPGVSIEPLSTSEENIWKGEKISKGDFIILNLGNHILYGRVLNFKFLGETSKKKSIYGKSFADFNSINKEKVGVLLDPVYTIQNFVKIPYSNNSLYYSLSNYAFHVKENVNFEDQNLRNTFNCEFNV